MLLANSSTKNIFKHINIKEKTPEYILIKKKTKSSENLIENHYDLFNPGSSPPQNNFMNKLNMRYLEYNNNSLR
jgi:hypothetical protein